MGDVRAAPKPEPLGRPRGAERGGDHGGGIGPLRHRGGPQAGLTRERGMPLDSSRYGRGRVVTCRFPTTAFPSSAERVRSAEKRRGRTPPKAAIAAASVYAIDLP